MRTRELRRAFERAFTDPWRKAERSALVDLCGRLEHAEYNLRRLRREARLMLGQLPGIASKEDHSRLEALLRQAEEEDTKREPREPAR